LREMPSKMGISIDEIVELTGLSADQIKILD